MSALASGKNLFLAGLSAQDFALIRPHLSRKELRVGETLHYCGNEVDEVIFPHSGLMVMSAPLRDGAGVGVALIGAEGNIGALSAAASAAATCDGEVLIAGQASRISASAFRYVLDQSATLRRRAAQFDNALMAQAQQIALCNAAHSVEARICRWLLDVQDRSGQSRIPFTQSAWGRMLAVRRTTVTLVAGRLEAAGLLSCRRGYMTIIDRAALEQHSCECYAHLKNHTVRLVAEPHDHAPVEGRAAGGASATPLVASRHS